MLLAALLQYAFHRKEGGEGRKYIIPAIIPLVPVAVVAAAYPSFIQRVLNLAIGGGGSVTGSTALSGLLSSVPVLQYMAVEVYDDVAFVVLIVLAAVYAYRSGVARNGLLLPSGVLVLRRRPHEPGEHQRVEVRVHGDPPAHADGRAGNLVPPPAGRDDSVDQETLWKDDRPQQQVVDRLRRDRLPRAARRRLVGDDHAQRLVHLHPIERPIAERGLSIDDCGSGTTLRPDSTFLSVSDWRFTYTSLMIGRNSVYQFESTPQAALPVAKRPNASYIIVTNAVTVNLPAEPSLFPWNNFKPSANLTMVYNNPDVEVFEIT